MPLEKLGDYRVLREIGRGGMGAVYEGVSPQGDRVAIKTILSSPDLDSRARWEMVERFMTEARAIRALEHRNIVSVVDQGQDEGGFFMVMEFLDGQSVRQLLDMVGVFPLAKAVGIANDVCGALHYAHQAGVIHRDIKPDNIVLLKSGVTKLTDFGLARIGEMGTHTQVGTMMGTFAYMSPEQAAGQKLCPRSDLFSLGVTVYEMIAGERPFRGEGSAAVLQAIMMQEPAPLASAPEHVQAAVRRCLAKDPAARFATAAEFAQALSGPEEGTVIGRPAVSISIPTPATPTAPGGPVVTGAPAAPPPVTQVAPSSQSPRSAPPAVTARDAQLPPGWFDGPGTPAPGAPRPTAAAARPGAPAPTVQNPSKVRCGCGEDIGWTDAVCWKCGRPNEVARARAQRQQEANTVQELQKLAAGLDPNKKKPWWKRR
jgi:serine/threonine-protein kinase